MLHEQKLCSGVWPTGVLSAVADKVVTGFPKVIAKGDWLGNPVREDIAALPAPAQRFANREGPLRILVVGGSLGAQALNDTVSQSLGSDPRLPSSPRYSSVRRKAN